MIQFFDAYLTKLRDTALAEQTEHTSRSALENLLGAFAARGSGIKVQHEPKRDATKGAPDFRITQKGMILGYVEVKKVGESLDKILKSDQIKKYQALSNNIILTDYLHFILIGPKGVKLRAFLAHESDLEKRGFKLKTENAKEVSDLLDQFFTVVPEGIGSSERLALALATRSKLLRDYLGDELVRQEREHQEGKLWGLYGALKAQVFHELTLKEFADAYAQMLAYGLFLAKLNTEEETKDGKKRTSEQKIVTLSNARDFVPASFQLIRELVDFLGELDKSEYREIKWVVEEVLSIVNGLDMAAISDDLSFKQRKAINRKVRAQDQEEHRLFERDPFIYFYEDYLKAFDKETRKARGVYYTPPPIVNFIVRAVDDILKDKFEIADGLADHKRVTVLDFACGTGTFLLEVMNRIFENIGGPGKGRAASLVREHILKNIYGFEYLIAPYTIAHLKLSQFLKDKGHPLKADERLQVYLTNTLEPIALQANLLLPAVTKEVQAAQEVKDKPILVIVGNPPYSGHSKNNSSVVKATIDAYKMVDGKPLGERNSKWLQDDYVKFIRFAQMKMDKVDEGVVGIITNHSWLDNPTFRGMRQSLMNSFEQIYVIDLHGNAKKKERAPDGGKDENVFDIEQGVAISLFVKKKGLERGVWRGDLWGKRLEKYQAAMNETLKGAAKVKLNPSKPEYLLLVQNAKLKEEFTEGWSLKDIFPLNSVGIVTGRDAIAIHFSKLTLLATVKELIEISPSLALQKYQIQNIETATAIHNDLLKSGNRESAATQILYRPFDMRWTYFTGTSDGFIGRPRKDVMKSMLDGGLALIAARSNKSQDMNHFFVSNFPSEAKAGESTTQSQLFSLYSNVGNKFVESLGSTFRAFLDAQYSHHYNPEEILGYIYAILHALSYRKRYGEFLRIDFPRIPFCETKPEFDALSKMGWDLVQVHLMKKLTRLKLGDFSGKGNNVVEVVRYSPNEQAIHINKTQHFAPVPEDVWNFHIGGYQVLDKWFKSRKGRELLHDDLVHVGNVVDALSFTVSQMGLIDTEYRAAFPHRG